MRYLAILLLFSSCSASFHCKKCFDKASVKSDTTRDNIPIPIPETKADSKFELSSDTKDINVLDGLLSKIKTPMIVENERIRTEVRFLPGAEVEIESECKADTLYIPVDKIITNTLHTGYKLVHLIGVGLGVFLLMLAVLFVLVKAR